MRLLNLYLVPDSGRPHDLPPRAREELIRRRLGDSKTISYEMLVDALRADTNFNPASLGTDAQIAWKMATDARAKA